MNRRDVLNAALGLTLCGSRVWAAEGSLSPQAPRFLLVFLRGGYDAANLLVPHASSFYYESRPNIAIARPQSDAAGQPAANTALPLDAQWALAPALQGSLYPLFQQRQLAFMPFAGVDDLSRSHFETQDRIEFGQAGDAVQRDYSSGFMNRLAAEIGAGRGTPVSSMAFTDQLPISFRGTQPVANQSLRNVGKPAVNAHQADLISRMYAGTAMADSVSEGFAVREEVSREMAAEMEAASRNAIAAKGFEMEARRMAHLMRDKVQLGFVDVGGWDTHVGEGGATGQLAGKLAPLGQGLKAFADEMGAQWQNTVVVVLSEFGRTFRENGNRGTDHGHGTVYWMMGGAVQGGRVVGEQVEVNARSLFQNRDYPVLNEYRAVLGGLFARLYGLDSAAIARIFPGARPRDWGLV